MELSPEEVRLIKQIEEYTKLVTDPTDLIGLCGNQPTLTKIRSAYQNKEITSEELTLVLTKLAQDLAGQEEPFDEAKEVYRYMFPQDLKPELNSIVLSAAEQVIAIKGILPKKKSYSGPRKKKEKPVISINKTVLPAHLQHLV
jgi:hypothetical protein